MRSAPECALLAFDTNITVGARDHMLLVIGKVPDRPCCWRVMIVSKLLLTMSAYAQKEYITRAINDLYYNGINTEKFIPFAPIKRKPYPIQLQLVQDPQSDYFTGFHFPSYLKIDKEYYVHADGLVEFEKKNGYHFQVRKKKIGGMALFKQFLAQRKLVALRPQQDQTVTMDTVVGLSGTCTGQTPEKKSEEAGDDIRGRNSRVGCVNGDLDGGDDKAQVVEADVRLVFGFYGS